MIDIKQFAAVDLKAGVIRSAEPVPDTDKLLKMEVDIGDGQERTMVAGIAHVYEPDEIVGLQVIVVANLEPATIRGVRSEGMVLAADIAGRPVLATFTDDVPPGAKVR